MLIDFIYAAYKQKRNSSQSGAESGILGSVSRRLRGRSRPLQFTHLLEITSLESRLGAHLQFVNSPAHSAAKPSRPNSS
jgi:hypothetical protein